MLACSRCRGPIDVSVSVSPSATGAARPDANLGDSYVVLSNKKQPGVDGSTTANKAGAPSSSLGAASAAAATLPDMSHTLAGGASGDGDFGAPWSEQLRTVSRLMDLSERMDHDAPAAACGVPLCQECGRGMLLLLQQQLEDAHMEREALQAASAELYAGEAGTGGGGGAGGAAAADEAVPLSAAESDREREAQRREEAALREELAKAEAERDGLRQALSNLQTERAAQLQSDEQRHALINGAFLRRQAAAEDELRGRQLVELCEAEVARLGWLDVLSDLFRIEGLTNNSGLPSSAANELGTINGLRLGRAPGVSVEWAELNAALGQVVLLVQALCRLHLPGGQFAQHVLVPHGSFSKVYSRKEPQRAFELFGSAQLSMKLFGGNARGVERGQAMLLACVDELVAHALAQPTVNASAAVPRLPQQPPVQVSEIHSLVSTNSAAEGRKLLAVLVWLVEWSRGVRKQQQAGAVAVQ